jgi:hypothetical protein
MSSPKLSSGPYAAQKENKQNSEKKKQSSELSHQAMQTPYPQI